MTASNAGSNTGGGAHRDPFVFTILLAEGQGFEPWEALTSLVFKTSAFDHSATPPEGSLPCVEVIA